MNKSCAFLNSAFAISPVKCASRHPYDLAEVDLVIDLLKRRREPLERRDRILQLAIERSHQTVSRDSPCLQVSACPQFPRTALSSVDEVWDFLLQTMNARGGIIPADSMKRVPDGAASLTYLNPPRVPAQYIELNKHGLLYAARHFGRVRFGQGFPEELHFEGLFQVLLRLTAMADRFYEARGYRGNLLIQSSVHGVQGQVMRSFDPIPYLGLEPGDLDDCHCFANSVTAERMLGVDEFRSRKVDVLTDILSEITWAFWQSNGAYPTARLRAMVERGIAQ